MDSPLGLLWTSGQGIQGTQGRAPTKGVSGCHLRVTGLQAFQLFPGGCSGFYETGEARAFLPPHVHLLLVAAKETRATPLRPSLLTGQARDKDVGAHTPRGDLQTEGTSLGKEAFSSRSGLGFGGGNRHTDTDSVSQSSSWANTVPT